MWKNCPKVWHPMHLLCRQLWLVLDLLPTPVACDMDIDDFNHLTFDTSEVSKNMGPHCHSVALSVTTAFRSVAFPQADFISAGRALAFTGAGISKESGVPTYRDGDGLWKRYDAMEAEEW